MPPRGRVMNGLGVEKEIDLEIYQKLIINYNTKMWLEAH